MPTRTQQQNLPPQQAREFHHADDNSSSPSSTPSSSSRSSSSSTPSESHSVDHATVTSSTDFPVTHSPEHGTQSPTQPRTVRSQHASSTSSALSMNSFQIGGDHSTLSPLDKEYAFAFDKVNDGNDKVIAVCPLTNNKQHDQQPPNAEQELQQQRQHTSPAQHEGSQSNSSHDTNSTPNERPLAMDLDSSDSSERSGVPQMVNLYGPEDPDVSTMHDPDTAVTQPDSSNPSVLPRDLQERVLSALGPNHSSITPIVCLPAVDHSLLSLMDILDGVDAPLYVFDQIIKWAITNSSRTSGFSPRSLKHTTRSAFVMSLKKLINHTPHHTTICIPLENDNHAAFVDPVPIPTSNHNSSSASVDSDDQDADIDNYQRGLLPKSDSTHLVRFDFLHQLQSFLDNQNIFGNMNNLAMNSHCPWIPYTAPLPSTSETPEVSDTYDEIVSGTCF